MASSRGDLPRPGCQTLSDPGSANVLASLAVRLVDFNQSVGAGLFSDLNIS